MPNPAPRRLGLLGGTFDPPHLGHLAAAQAVLAELHLDRVDFLVAHDPWQKSDSRSVTTAAIRLEMVEALAKDQHGLGVDDREIRRGGLTYTADTLEEIHRESPGVEIFLIVGADTAARLSTWHRPDVVRRLSTLVVVNRAGQHEESNDSSAVHVTMQPVDVSSTKIRDRVSRGESIESLTSPDVARIIEARSLYRGPQ